MKPLQINNKHYQECDVVMLQTDKAENSLYASYDKILNYYSGHLTQDYLKNVLLAKSYHLYILSNDEIKKGDWFFSSENTIEKYIGSIMPIYLDKKIIATTDSSLKQDLEYINGGKCGEVCLLQIPKSFIEKYITEHNKGNVISNVLVEIEDDYSSVPENEEDIIFPWRAYVTSKIKVNQSYEISILTKKKTLLSNLQSELQKYIDKRHNQDECSGFVDGFERACELDKESYSREEVVALLEKMFYYGADCQRQGNAHIEFCDSWIEQNLK
jgi:hypothetical protein